MAVTYSILKDIVECMEMRSQNYKNRLKDALLVLKPNMDVTKIPKYSNLLRKLRHPKINLQELVQWTLDGPVSLGSQSDRIGLTSKHLDEEPTDFPQCTEINNGLILELRSHWYKNKYTWNVFGRWMNYLTGGKCNTPVYILSKRINKVHSTYMKLLTHPCSGKIKTFLGTDFHWGEVSISNSGELDVHGLTEQQPEIVLLPAMTCETIPASVGDDSVQSCEDTPSHDSSAYQNALKELETVQASADHLMQEISHTQGCTDSCRLSYRNISEKYQTCRQTLSDLRQAHRAEKKNYKRREMRKDKRIIEQAKDISNLKSNLINVQNRLATSQRSRKNAANLKYYHERHCQELHNQLKASLTDVELQETSIRQADKENGQLVNKMYSMLEDRLEIDSFRDGRYIDEIRETVMALGSLGVSASQMSKVIETVSQGIFGATITRLPSETTVKQFLTESNILAKLQICEAMLESKDSTLHVDGTTDHQRHFFAYQIGTSSGNFALTLKETIHSDSSTQLHELQGTVKELASLVTNQHQEQEDVSNKLLFVIKNLMTDQASVNKKFREQFEEVRLGILQRSETSWATLTEAQQKNLVKLNQWFCFLHVLVGLAEASEDGLRDYQEIVTSSGTVPLGREVTMPDCRRDSSAAVETIKAVCNLLTPSGHPAAGIPEDFRAFMMEKNKKVHLIKFAHTRFNVIFHNASATWFHRNDILEFLFEVSQSNQLIEAVKGDIGDNVLLACIRGMAIFHVQITAPFHSLILSDNISHILDLNPYMKKLQSTLELLSQNPWVVLRPDFDLWPDRPPKKDTELFIGVMASSQEEDNLTISMEVLSLIATHCLVTFSRQVAPHLPGGEHSDDNVELRAQSTSVATSNSIGESQFALLKHLRQIRPNANVENIEASIMWAYNKTYSWLRNLTPARRSEVLTIARAKTSAFKDLWKQRRHALTAQRSVNLKERVEKEAAKAVKCVNDKQKILDDVDTAGGQCRTVQDVDGLVERQVSERDRVLALKSQLRFYKTVIKSPAVDKGLYLFSQKGSQFNSSKLEANLKSIIMKHIDYVNQAPSTSSSSVPVIPAADVRQSKIQQVRKSVLCNYASVPSTSSVANCRKGQKRVGKFEDPVGKRIRHRWKIGKRHKWYSGSVVGECDSSEKPTHTDDEDDNVATSSVYKLYRVAYDGEDEQYNLRIEKDWYRGDIEFLKW